MPAPSVMMLMMAVVTARQPAPLSGQVITAACGVRVRATPGPQGREETRLGLGVVLTVTAQKEVAGGPQGASVWFQVVEPAGWVAGSLVRPFLPQRRWQTVRGLAEERVRVDSPPVEDAMDAVDFVERALADTPPDAVRGPLQLTRLQLLARVAERLPQPLPGPVRRWTERQSADLTWDELGGGWMVADRRFWALFESHRGQPWAESMALAASRAAVPGECEGIAPCILDRTTATRGRYLQAFPDGPHAADVLGDIRTDLREGLSDDLLRGVEPGDVPMALESLAALRARVEAVTGAAAERSAVVQELARVERGLKKRAASLQR